MVPLFHRQLQLVTPPTLVPTARKWRFFSGAQSLGARQYLREDYNKGHANDKKMEGLIAFYF